MLALDASPRGAERLDLIHPRRNPARRGRVTARLATVPSDDAKPPVHKEDTNATPAGDAPRAAATVPAVPAKKAKRGRGPKRFPLHGTLPNSVVWTPRYRRAAKAQLQRWADRQGKVDA